MSLLSILYYQHPPYLSTSSIEYTSRDLQNNAHWIIKYCLTIISTILFMVSTLYNSHTQTELGSIIYQAVHCIYCNPGFYPHGLLWYAIVIPIAYFGTPVSDMLVFAGISMVISIFNINNNYLFYPFFLVNFYDYFVIPQNLPVLWLTTLGTINPTLLILPIIAKLPVGAPYPVWQFVFNTSLHITTNYQADYGVLVIFWLYILAYYYRIPIKRGIKALEIKMSKVSQN